ncbi:MAG: dTDP-4-dehydrorhamnose 3,5-epimerase [Bacteroidota bacterium]
MKATETKLKGCYILNPTLHKDHRGCFFESYHERKFQDHMGTNIHFVQDNHSISKKGVLRGLHFQKGEHAQTKLVRVVRGEVLDVVVDLRKKSKTFGKHMKIRLSESNQKILFIPKGMAHGFLALSNETVFVYKCDRYYNSVSEGGIIYNDSHLGIDWEYPMDRIILSEKDQLLPKFKELEL